MMRNATPLKPLDRQQRSTAVIRRWKQQRDAWMTSLEPSMLFQRLFDHLPGVYFFAKNRDGHLMFATVDFFHLNFSMVEETKLIYFLSKYRLITSSNRSCW